jgi:hypothetical protein
MRNRNAEMPPNSRTAATVASSISVTQSHSTLNPGVFTTSARCPIANFGCVWMERMPGAISSLSVLYVARITSSPVQRWPSSPTYCRKSSQIGHLSGCDCDSGNWTPQVSQIQAVPIGGLNPFVTIRV